MNFQLPLALAVCSTGFFFLSQLLLIMVNAVLDQETT